MRQLGVILIGGGVGSYFFGCIGGRVERKWDRLDPGPRRLTGTQQFALARQKAVMRQGPMFRRLGVVATGAGILLVVLAAAF